MMQPKRPISRSSTPIEFAPLILDLEPEVKDEPKNKGSNTKLLMVIAGTIICLAMAGYFGLRKSGNELATNITATPAVQTTPSSPAASPSLDGKKQVFTHGASRAKLTLENAEGQDILRVVVEDKAAQGTTWVYEWSKNNQPAGSGETVAGFKRGDTIAVKITPFDGKNYGKSKVLTTEIQNTAPRVSENSLATIDGNKFTYQVKASDPDGDSLTYALVDGPQGATIDSNTGVITWTNIPDDRQKIDLKVKISDGHKGEIIYPLTVNFPRTSNEKLTAQK